MFIFDKISHPKGEPFNAWIEANREAIVKMVELTLAGPPGDYVLFMSDRTPPPEFIPAGMPPPQATIIGIATSELLRHVRAIGSSESFAAELETWLAEPAPAGTIRLVAMTVSRGNATVLIRTREIEITAPGGDA